MNGESITFEQKKEIERILHEYRMVENTNQFSMNFAKQALNGCFILNGAAATALLASKVAELFFSAAILGMGALVAILAIGVSYWFTLVLLESWRCTKNEDNDKYIPTFIPFKGYIFLSDTDVEKCRYIPVVLFVVSALLFLIGLAVAATAV